jgi:hypothetical protein
VLALSIFAATIAGFMANIYFKISMHGIGAGVALGFMIFLGLTGGVNFGLYLSVTLLLAGLVCTARLIVSNHSQTEIYVGLVTGMLAVLIATWFN